MPSKNDEILGDYFNLSVPNDLRILYEMYRQKYRNLGYKTVSQLMIKVLQDNGEEIIKENPEFKEIREVTLKSGTYELQEDGSYQKIS